MDEDFKTFSIYGYLSIYPWGSAYAGCIGMEHAFLFATGVPDGLDVERTLLFKCCIHRDMER